MAEIGTVTVRVAIDSRQFRVQLRRVRRHLYLRIICQAFVGLVRGR